MHAGGSQSGGIASRHEFARILDGLYEAVCLLTPPGLTVAYANEACLELLGAGDVTGRSVNAVWDGTDPRIATAAAEVLATGREATISDVRVSRDGKSAHFSICLRRSMYEGEPIVVLEADETTREVLAREGAQRESGLLSDVLDRMSDGFYSLDREWRFVYVNENAARLLRYPREELIGRDVWRMFPEAVGSTFHQEFQRAMREQTPASFQEYYAPLDMWAAVQAYPSESGLSVFLSDVTALKKHETALGRSEGQLRAVIDNSPNVIIMKDLSGTIIRVNDEFARNIGISKDDLVGLTDYDLVRRDVADAIAARDRHVMTTGEPRQFDEDIITKEGVQVRLLTTRFPLKDSSGRVYGVASISVDITQRSKQERALAESEERFRKVFEEGPVGITLLGPDDLRLVQVNDMYARILGRTKDELVGESIIDLTVPEDRHKTRQLIDLVVRGEIPFYRWDKRYIRGDGSTIWVAVTGSLIKDEEGRPSLFLGMVEDITQRKQAEASLRDKDRAIREAYSDVIGAVTGGKLVFVTPDEMKELLGTVISREWTVSEYSESSTVRHGLEAALIDAGMSKEDADDYVLAAGEAITNAVKHGGGGRLRVRRTGTGLQVEVVDHGPGIDFEDLPKATLMAGYSTKQSLGVGFTIMLEVCDRLLLTTQPGLTALVLEKTF